MRLTSEISLFLVLVNASILLVVQSKSSFSIGCLFKSAFSTIADKTDDKWSNRS